MILRGLRSSPLRVCLMVDVSQAKFPRMSITIPNYPKVHPFPKRRKILSHKPGATYLVFGFSKMSSLWGALYFNSCYNALGIMSFLPFWPGLVTYQEASANRKTGTESKFFPGSFEVYLSFTLSLGQLLWKFFHLVVYLLQLA